MNKRMTLAAIILTKTSNSEILKTTLECAESLVKKANTTTFDLSVIVVESDPAPVGHYPSWIRHIVINEPFNFHRFLNLGVKEAGHHDWYLLCNNDLLFDDNWLYEIEKVILKNKDIHSLSPISPTCREQQHHLKGALAGKDVVYGYTRRDQLSGWCLMISTHALAQIGPLDERFQFYFADDDYALCLRRHNIIHVLVPNSRVFHLEDKKMSKPNHKRTRTLPEKPSYLCHAKLRWITESEDMLAGFIEFQKKWGDYRIVAIKRKLHDFLFLRLGIKALSSALFRPIDRL